MAPPKKNGYKMPPPLPVGEVITDLTKKQWKIGPSIGKGGFGEIYSAVEADKKTTKFPYVIKIEPHGNGPLFVEMHFYMKCAKAEDIAAFKSTNKLKTFGMPSYLGSGSHDYKDEKFRFIVMERFGADVDKIWRDHGKTIPESTVFLLAHQMTHVLEFIHSNGYVHCDLKGANILLGLTPDTKDQSYLVDFGLATKFSTKEFKPNPKKAHDGTIEYCSRDAHHGVPSMRGDFEILGYNLIHWLGGKLPWDNKLKDPKVVHELKENAMKDIPGFMESAFEAKPPETLVKFLTYVNSLTFNEVPKYKKILDLFKAGAGGSIGGSLQFKSPKKRKQSADQTPTKKTKSAGAKQKKTAKLEEEDGQGDQNNGTKPKKRVNRKDSAGIDFNNPQPSSSKVDTSAKDAKKQKKEEAETFTPAMLEVMAKKRTQGAKKTHPKTETNTNGFTDEMKEVAAKKTKTRKVKEVNGDIVSAGPSGQDGFTDEMKEVAMRRQQNGNDRLRRAAPVNYRE